MRSKIAQRILEETPEEVKQKVRDYGEEIVRRNAEIDEIYRTLPENEIIEAKMIYARTKWHKIQNSPYWDKKEAIKPGKAKW